jgi:signal peptidase II
VVALILLWVRNVDDIGALVPLGMILGGGLGNVFDRLFRDLGGRVVDFVDVGWWPVFNLADSCIVTGVGLILLVGVRSRPPGSDEARARG